MTHLYIGEFPNRIQIQHNGRVEIEYTSYAGPMVHLYKNNDIGELYTTTIALPIVEGPAKIESLKLLK